METAMIREKASAWLRHDRRFPPFPCKGETPALYRQTPVESRH